MRSSKFISIIVVITFSLSSAAPALGQSYYGYPNQPEKKRNPLGRAALSYLVPGFDQWTENQTGPAIAYSGVAVIGLATALASWGDLTQSVTTKDDRARTTFLGLKTYETMGSLSAFHAFRNAITTRKPEGEYPFLSIEETPGDLLIAPFRFDYLFRPTTLLPMLILGGLVALDYFDNTNRTVQLSTADGFFTSALSYEAGVGEEAMFRGVMQPLIMEMAADRRPFAANLVQALVFGAAHYSPNNPLPWPQFLMGLYFGWLTEHRDYTLSENIFLHVWWDVVAIGADYALPNRTVQPRPLYLPLLNVRF